MKQIRNFMGFDGFVWWLGIVESRQDPLKLGRAQVRIYGHHTDDKTLIPTADLPWAQPILPINLAETPKPPKEGDLVVGFFLDGDNAQLPVMMGKLPVMQKTVPPSQKGFSDPGTDTSIAPLKPVTRKIKKGGGIDITPQAPDRYPRLPGAVDSQPVVLGEPTTSRLGRHEHVYAKPTIPAFLNENFVTADSVRGTKWKEPKPGYNTQYPYNLAVDTESGHVWELDDTKGQERVTLYHRTGTGFQIYPTGTMDTKVVKDQYDITHGNAFTWVGGKTELSVENIAKVRIKGATIIEIDGDCDIKIGGTMNVSVGKNINFKSGGSINFDIGKSWTSVMKKDTFIKTAGATHLTSGKNFNYDAAIVFAQSSKALAGSLSGIAGALGAASGALGAATSALASVSSAVAAGASIASIAPTLAAVSSTVSGITSQCGSIVSSVTDMASQAVGPIATTLGSVTSSVSGLTSGLSSVTSTISSVLNGGISTVSAVQGAISSITDTIGSTINSITGITNTINSALGSVTSAIGSVSSVISSIADIGGEVTGLALPNPFANLKENINTIEKSFLDGAVAVSTLTDPASNVLRPIEQAISGIQNIILSNPITQAAASIMSQVQTLGFSVTQTAAMVGNMMNISGLESAGHNDLGFGLLGFSGDRLTGLTNYANTIGSDISNTTTQLEYVKLESTGGATAYGGLDLTDAYRTALGSGNVMIMSIAFANSVMNMAPSQATVNFSNAFIGIASNVAN